MSKSTLGRTLAVLVMVLALAGTTSLMAQTRAKIGVGGGGTLARGDFGDVFKTGWHGQVMVLSIFLRSQSTSGWMVSTVSTRMI